MDISEKKIEEIALRMRQRGYINIGPVVVRQTLDEANITGKDGLLVALQRAGAFILETKALHDILGCQEELDAINSHLSQWRQK